ncbi:MerR family transcriptional regulator, partial [Lactiplantibacillus plantarum]
MVLLLLKLLQIKVRIRRILKLVRTTTERY